MRHRILVVSNGPELASRLREAERRSVDSGLESPPDIDEAASGEAAMQKLASLSPDLTLVDHRLPDMTGMELIRVLRLRGVEQPLVLVVRRESLELAIRSLNQGADDFLVRPVSDRALRDVVRTGVGPSEQEEGLALPPELSYEGD